MSNYFTISEFLILKGYAIRADIADAILQHHILPMNRVREELGAAITVSKSSGYRPYHYEKTKGRAGNSQHTFRDKWPKGRGAADYTANDIIALLNALFKCSDYVRICYYPHANFIHCDYKEATGREGKRCFYIADKKNKWHFKSFIDKDYKYKAA